MPSGHLNLLKGSVKNTLVLYNRVSRLPSGRGSQEVERPSERESPQDWHEAVDEINRKMQDLARGIQRQRRDHDDIISRFETVKSHVEQ